MYVNYFVLLYFAIIKENEKKMEMWIVHPSPCLPGRACTLAGRQLVNLAEGPQQTIQFTVLMGYGDIVVDRELDRIPGPAYIACCQLMER